MRLVLGGSRSLNTVPEVVQIQLRAWFAQGEDFLIGDSTGADAVMQRLLADWACTRVTVFTSVPTARVNIGSWRVQHVDSGLKAKSHAMHTAKDRVMTQAADTGLMLWDGQSVGTLANILDLLRHGKAAYLFNAQREQFWPLDSATGERQLSEQNGSAVEAALKRLTQYSKRVQRQQAHTTRDTGTGDVLFDV